MHTFNTWFDNALFPWARRASLPMMRFALFSIFFWFGILKVFHASAAATLVEELLAITMPFFPFSVFFVLLGLFEMGLGILFLIRGVERVAALVLAAHMATTFLPLVLLPALTWNAPFAPTLEGQYIVKNLALIALALGVLTMSHQGQITYDAS